MFYRRSRHAYPIANRERGAALVVALLVFALSASLVVAMRSEFNRYFTRSANLLEAEQAHAYLRGAEELAVMVLLADFDLDQQNLPAKDDLNEMWADEPTPFLLDEGGWLRGGLIDLNSRFNINTLRITPQTVPPVPPNSTRVYSVHQKQFIRLLQALEEPEISESDAKLITDSIADWIDEDQTPLPQGAEDDYYFGQEPPRRTANRPMTSTTELLSIANMTPQIYRALRPFITAWPSDATDFKINIHTASATILRTINDDDVLSPLSESDGLALKETRDETGFEDLADFYKQPAFDAGKMNITWANDVLDVTSDYYLLTADVAVGDRNMNLYSVLHQDNRAVTTLVRSTGDL
ncbi:MAG: type II secretion system minor pseudopilin GspK [Halioglobus sp.]